jgi:hypothetical protein
MNVFSSNRQDARLEAPPKLLWLHTYCRHHKKVEAFSISVSYAISISVCRPSHEIRCNLFDRHRERSHLCHDSYCEHPLHSIPESIRQNRSRTACRNNAHRLSRKYDAKTAPAITYNECQHEPPCFSYNAELISKMEEAGAEAFQLAMRTHGMCKKCKLDFPVHLGRTNPFKRRGELYSPHGRADDCVADEWHSAQWATSMWSLLFRWFDVLHQHRTQVHLGICKGKDMWANMKELQDPWWSSTKVARKKDLFTYGTGAPPRNNKTRVYQSDFIDVTRAGSLESWAGWRQAYI